MTLKQQLVSVLREFVEDVDAVYTYKKDLETDWFDLLETYKKAVRVLRLAGESQDESDV